MEQRDMIRMANQIATFFNEAGLEAIGDNLLLETAASGPATVGAPGEVGYGRPSGDQVESGSHVV